MTARNYINDAPQTTTTGALTAGSTSITVVSAAGYPAAPFAAALGLDSNGNFSSSTELVLVTNVAGNVLTVTRGFDGSSAISHPGGETFNHVAAAIDLREANQHVNASAGVHGVTGAVVGTTDSQTMSNKTLTNPTVNGASTSGTISGTAKLQTSSAATDAISAASGTVAGKFVKGVVQPTQFSNEAAATAASANASGNIVYLTTPTTVGFSAGYFIWNGTGWQPLAPMQSFTGTPLLGAYDATKPIHHIDAHLIGTSDASGFVVAGGGGIALPSSTTAVLRVNIGAVIGQAGSWIAYRGDISSLTLIRFQTRNMDTTGAAKASAAYDFSAEVAYQI